MVYFVGFGTGTAPAQVDGQKALIEKFNASHPDIEVELMIVPHEEAITRFTAMVAGGDAPEVIGPAGFWIMVFWPIPVSSKTWDHT